MRFFGLTALFCGLLLCTPAVAADITMLAPASVALGAQALADAFAKETGNKVTLTGGGRQKILDAVKTGTGDVVVLPAGDMDALTADLAPGSRTPLVRIPVGVAVKVGAPHPDITTPEKFRTAILASGAVSYTDPSVGTSAGATIDRILKRPEYAGAKLKPIMGSAVAALSQGKTEMALQMITEIPGVQGIELVGPVPPGVGAEIAFDAAVPAHAAASAEALAFIRYLTRPAAASAWKAKGLQPAN
jgi:molybdate transport system substrate-binding protein